MVRFAVMRAQPIALAGFLLLAAGGVGWGADIRNVISARARLLKDFPGQQIQPATPEVLSRAKKIAGGTVFFYGTTPVEVGLKNIDWSGSHIRHQEWPAQLNRFFHLEPLAAAYRATGDETFARAARAYIEDWLREDPYRSAESTRPGDNTLNISIRLGSSVHSGWGGALPVFLKSPAFDDAFVGRVLASMAHQAGFLSRRLTASGNWRISQLDALVFTALRFPFLENAPRLLEAGIAGMQAALATQFLPDGVHIERTPGYADWMARVAVNYSILPRIVPNADAGVRRERVLRSLDYMAQSELFGVNDASAPHRDPAALRGLQTREELLRRLLPGKAVQPPPLEQVFPDAGQVFLRSGWSPGSDYLAFDASTWGGGHGHLSRLSFVFRSRGRALVADPGILTYEMTDPFGPYGKSTAAHSTLNLEGGNQSGADAQLLRTAFAADVALVHARYQGGYWTGRYGWNFNAGRGTGTYGSHERVLLWVKGGYVLVLDSMEADPGADIRNCWQLGPMERWKQDPARLEWWSENPDGNLWLAMVRAPESTRMRCWEGSREPLRGWVGSRGHESVPAPLVEFSYPAGRGPASSAVLLAPFTGTARPGFRVRVPEGGGPVQRLEIGLPDGFTDLIAWSGGLALPVDDGRPFLTDGTLVWVRLDAGGKPVKHFSLNGRFLKFNGTPLTR